MTISSCIEPAKEALSAGEAKSFINPFISTKVPFFKKEIPSSLFIKYQWMWTWHFTRAASKVHMESYISYERWKAWRLLGAL